MKKFEEPEVKFEVLEVSDVITASLNEDNLGEW
jgi:hypothetical protein